MSIVDLFNDLPEDLKAWAAVWLADGAYEGPPFESEPPLITAKLRPFRLAYENAGDEQIEELLEKI